MRVCGIELAGSEARLIMLEGSVNSYVVVDCPTKKLPLENSASQEDIKSLKTSFDAIFRDYRIEKVAVKKRPEKGGFAGGGKSFKMETLIQLSECEVELLSPQTIASRLKRSPQQIPRSINKYQETAFQTAYAALPQ
jgi:prolyl-tRNA synthetase